MSLGIQFSPLRALLVPGFIAATSLTSLAQGSASQPADNPAAIGGQLAQNYGRVPLSFQANQGQADKAAKFLSNGSGYSLFLTDSSAVLALTKPEVSSAKAGVAAGKGLKAGSAQKARKTDVVRMELAGGNRGTQITGVDPLPGTANYFIGSDPSKWHSVVPTFAQVKYAGVYPGIDLVYYGNQRQLEYDFIVAPGASAKPIRLEFAGAKKLRLDGDGDLTVSATNGEIAFHKPVVYQVKDGVRQPVDGQFAMLKKNAIGFTLGRYDHSKPLVIDPVLSYSTYLGGSLADGAHGVAADSSGNAYVVGSTFSTNFPVTTGASQTVNKEPSNFQCVFIAKLNPTGTALVYSTYLGGTGANNDAETQYGDVGQAIAVDSSGDAYVTGLTQSTTFPTTPNAFQLINKSTLAGEIFNAFVTKLNPTGTALIYSTYLGGNFEDYASGIAVDTLGDAYVTGRTSSSTFPVTAGAYQVTNDANITDGWTSAFVTELNRTGTAPLYSTYLGGTGYGAVGAGIAVDGLGDAYVTGYANTIDFPITNGAFQTLNKAAAAVDSDPDLFAANVFVTKLNPTGTQLEYSTFVGGTTNDFGQGIALDGAGDAYVTGYTDSSDYPVLNAYQPTNLAYANEASAAFVTEVNPTGTGLVYSTFLSGSGIPPQNCGSGCTESGSGDSGTAIAVDGLGDAYVTGNAVSSNFPTTAGAYQTVNNAAGHQDPIGINAFITKLNPGGSQLLYSTYLGGNVQDLGNAIALDGLGGVFVAGQAASANFPTTAGAYQTASAGGASDAFITEFAIGSVAAMIGTTTTLTSNANPQVQGSQVTFTATVTPASGTGVPTGNVVFSVDGVTAATWALSGLPEAGYVTSSLTTGTHTIQASYSGSAAYTASSATLTETITEPQAAAPVFSSAVGTYTSTQSVTITDSTTGATIYYTTNGTTPTASSTLYSGAITVSATETIEAIAIASGFSNSAVASAAYTINLAAAATPVISPTAGTFSSTQSVTITDSTSGATIYYSTNGTTPTASSTQYTGAISVSATETIEAIAIASGYTNSAVASATYTIQAQTAAAMPVFSTAAGTFTSTQSVTITDSTTGAAIYYTTNGTTPTASSTLYTGPITVSASETIEAIAIAAGFTNSAVATSNYIIVVTAPGYTLSANPAFLLIKSGSTGSTIITVTPAGGFTGTVNFSCGTLPPEVSCAFAPASLTVSSAAAQTATLTIGTTGAAVASLRDGSGGTGPDGTRWPEIFVAMILVPLGFTRRILRARKAGGQWLMGLLLVATASLAAAGMVGLDGCGGKSGPSTPPGTYSIPIDVTSGGTTAPLSLSIIVQ